MRKKIFIGVGVILVALIGLIAYGALVGSKKSPYQETEYTAGDLDLKVTYCKPFKKGRLIFGSQADEALVPNGVYWRLGANDATEITFSKDVTFGGTPISAGSYRMYAMPNAESWDITLNSEVGKFGFFEPNAELDVATITVPVGVSGTEVEQLTIDFDGDSSGANMNITWDKTKITVPIGM